jgi:hypothetical protein
VDHASDVYLCYSHNHAFRHSGDGCQTQWLSGQAPFPKEIAGSQKCDHGFLALLGDDGLCRYGEELITIELQIEPEIIMHGQADKLAPGVVYHPEYYGIAPFEHFPDIGEVIAYGINEGRVTQDTIELDDGSHYRVRSSSVPHVRARL